MTTPELIHELRASRPTAPSALKSRIREISAQEAAPGAGVDSGSREAGRVHRDPGSGGARVRKCRSAPDLPALAKRP
jgi:hypothetical protein